VTPQQNDLLCLIEGEAPMGKLMRQHWLPVCMREEVAEPDCSPVRARLLGEDLVVFRDTRGAVGVLDERCPHRRASLAFGRNEECGLRCLYHGWKFDVNGDAVEVPSEPVDARQRAARKARAYPVRESGGFIWVWMGPPEAPARFDPPPWAPGPDTRISIMKMHAACNWAQVLEGALDSAHSSSLHATNMPGTDSVAGSTATDTLWLRPSTDKAPRIEVQPTSFGFRYAAIRKPLRNPDTHQYVRTTLFIAPFTVLIPPNNQYNLAQMLVPVDNTNCMFYWIAWHPTKGIEQDAWRRFCGAVVGVDVDHEFRKFRNASNRYQQDREAMRRGDFTGIYGIPAQDMAMWESMGPIADRSQERLGTSDRAVIQFRKQMLAAVRDVGAGKPAIGTLEPRIPHVLLGSFEGVIEKRQDWRTLNVSEEELRARAPVPSADLDPVAAGDDP
jgi:phthalate 4,5-dioxygenase oxygenase subunit